MPGIVLEAGGFNHGTEHTKIPVFTKLIFK